MCRDLGRKEARQIVGCLFLGDRPGKEIASPDERHGENWQLWLAPGGVVLRGTESLLTHRWRKESGANPSQKIGFESDSGA
jgi:hypothetical protein